MLEIDLETGRKHQIRAQLSHIGHPICGDLKYLAPKAPPAPKAPGAEEGEGAHKRRRGGKGRVRPGVEEGSLERGIALHAYSLAVPHPVSKDRMRFTAKIPSTWTEYFGADVAEKINTSLLL